MRTTSYKCDRCGKTLSTKTAIKINLTMQNGINPVEKKTSDFCKTCLGIIKAAYKDAMALTDKEKAAKQAADEKAAAVKAASMEALKTAVVEKSGTVQTESKAVQEPKAEQIERQKSETKQTESKTVQKSKTEQAESKVVQEPKRKGRPPKNPNAPKKGLEKVARAEGIELKTGPIKEAEKQEILRLYVEEELEPDDIAEKLNRLPRGIKRAINSAEKNGELAKMREALSDKKHEEAEKQANDEAQNAIHNLLSGMLNIVPDENVEDLDKEDEGSGASDANVTDDSYTAPPQSEVIDGKKYDVGGILALSRAGWSVEDIADEKHYKDVIVQDIISRYLR